MKTHDLFPLLQCTEHTLLVHLTNGYPRKEGVGFACTQSAILHFPCSIGGHCRCITYLNRVLNFSVGERQKELKVQRNTVYRCDTSVVLCGVLYLFV